MNLTGIMHWWYISDNVELQAQYTPVGEYWFDEYVEEDEEESETGKDGEQGESKDLEGEERHELD